MSLPAIIAFCAASLAFFANPQGIISAIEPQSLTTKPLYPHLPFKISRCKYEFPVAGTPFKVLKEFMKVATLASAAALNGGR